MQAAAGICLACAAAGLAIEVPVGVPRPARASPSRFPVVDAVSFSAPFDNVNAYTGERIIDHWDLGGAAMVHRNFLRLTSDAQGHRGWVTNDEPLPEGSWSAVLKFRVSGRNDHLYGDGMALWAVSNPSHMQGTVFGREDMWDGIGVFFDTFQNADKSHHHKHPYISVISNDGTHHYEPRDELGPPGAKEASKHAVPGREEGSGCSFDFRYSEARDDFSVLNVTLAHIVYNHAAGRMTLRVRQSAESDWSDCIDVAVRKLDGEHFFGLSAATGDLVDNHDVLSFTVHRWPTSPQRGPLEVARDRDVQESDDRLMDVRLDAPTPSEANLVAVVEDQAAEIRRLRSTLAVLQHRLEYELSSVHRGLSHAKEVAESGAARLDVLHHEVIDGLAAGVGEEMERRIDGVARTVQDSLDHFERNSKGGLGLAWWALFVMIIALFAYGHNRYNKIMKTHFL